MRVIQLTTTADPDGRLRFDIPADAGEYEVAVVLTPKVGVNGTAQPADVRRESRDTLGNLVGSVTDDTFVEPTRRTVKRIESADGE